MKTNEIAIQAIKNLADELFHSSIYKESRDLDKDSLKEKTKEEVEDYAFYASCEIIGNVSKLNKLAEHLKWLEENDYFGMND